MRLFLRPPIPFPDFKYTANFQELGESARDILEFSLLNSAATHEAMDSLANAVRTPENGKIIIPFDALRNDYVGIYLAGRELCEKAKDSLTDKPSNDKFKHSFHFLLGRLSMGLLNYQNCCVAIRPRKEITLPKIGTFTLQDTNAKPFDRNYAWPIVRPSDLRC